MLAMIVNDDDGYLTKRGACGFLASKLAPARADRPFQPGGLPFWTVCRYTRRLSKVRQRVLPAMEINPILNSIKDLSERSETIRGYL